MKIIMDYDNKMHHLAFSSEELRKGITKDLDIEMLSNIVAYLDVATKQAKPSQDLLSENMGISRQGVAKRITALLEKHPELITRELKSTKGKIGYMKHSVYTIDIPVEIVTSKPQYRPDGYKPVDVRSQAEVDAEEEYNRKLLESL